MPDQLEGGIFNNEDNFYFIFNSFLRLYLCKYFDYRAKAELKKGSRITMYNDIIKEIISYFKEYPKIYSLLYKFETTFQILNKTNKNPLNQIKVPFPISHYIGVFAKFLSNYDKMYSKKEFIQLIEIGNTISLYITINGLSTTSLSKNDINNNSENNFKIARLLIKLKELLLVYKPRKYVYLIVIFSLFSALGISLIPDIDELKVFSCFPCLKPVKRTTETAENWLITAETGGGKSFFVKGLLVQLLAMSNYNGTIMDVEGFEYIPLANYLATSDKVIIINMAEGTGVYYDPVEIILTGNEELDRDMYSLSTSFTLSLFKCLLDNTEDEDEWVDIVINDAVSLTYAMKGVSSSDMSTWGNSKGLSLYHVYNMLKLLKSNGNAERAIGSMFTESLYEEKMGGGKKLSQNDVNRLITSNPGYQKSIDLCIAKISRYFEPDGVRASLFKNRISIDDIKDAKLVVCSFGMAGKSENSVDSIQMSLMQLYSANISHLRSIFSKHRGIYNFKLWEEFQRWGGFPDADKTINVALTGGRKLGDVNIIITNKVIDMLNDDKFGVFSNVTSFAIGAIGDSFVREELCNRLTIANMIPDLNAIANNNKDLSAYVDGDTVLSNPYRKAFLIGLDRTIYTVSKMIIPRGLASSKIFKTGVEEQLSEDKVVINL